jgi:hypothetical protein
VRFSKSLAVYAFVYNLSSKWGPLALGPSNSFKTLFTGSPYDQEKYKNLIDDFNKTTLAYELDYQDYAGLGKIALSTESLLWKELVSSQSVAEFKQRAVGIIPNPSLFKIAEVLAAFEPVYDELVYQPNKEAFEKQLRDLDDLIATTDMGRYFDVGIKFYGSVWDNSIPVNMYFYPLPNAKGFTATVFFNNAISGIPSTLTDYNGLLSVAFHEMFHILYDEQPLDLRKQIDEWQKTNPSKASHYAFALLNEALATALGNGYVSGQLKGKLNEGKWYNRKYISEMAKKIYAVVTQYIDAGKPMDKSFIDEYVKVFDENFTDWLYDLDFLLTERYVISDDRSDFEILDRKFPYRNDAFYKTVLTELTLLEMKARHTTKMVVISAGNNKKLELVKKSFPELSNWKPDGNKDFTYAQMLNDKTYLIVINSVKAPFERQLETLTLR